MVKGCRPVSADHMKVDNSIGIHLRQRKQLSGYFFMPTSSF
jgi:hypothetical protein